jgi:PleD family two-component response regulator
MRILVVDDSDDARELTEAALQSAGFSDVVTAASAWEAFKLLDLGRTNQEGPTVDIILLDIVMPEVDGVEACARIRNDIRYCDVPIIMVTSLEDMDSLSNAFAAGANDYVTKPVKRAELIARVRAALKLKAELERRQLRERELLSFLSTWSDRRATLWVDEATGMFVGEVAEAYLTATTKHKTDDVVSILALALDNFDDFRAVHGDEQSSSILSQVSHAMRGIAATVGIVAAAYRNGLFIFIAPEVGATAARQLGETLCKTIGKLRLTAPETSVADHVTATVAAVTGHVRRGIDRVHLLTRAVASVQGAMAAGGNRVVAETV